MTVTFSQNKYQCQLPTEVQELHGLDKELALKMHAKRDKDFEIKILKWFSAACNENVSET